MKISQRTQFFNGAKKDCFMITWRMAGIRGDVEIVEIEPEPKRFF